MANSKKITHSVKQEHKIGIYKNCLQHNNNLTLFFLIDQYNYGVYSSESIAAHIQRLYNIIGSLDGIITKPRFTIYDFDNIVSPQQYMESFTETVKLWNPNFTPSQEFVQNIPFLSKRFCVLAICIDTVDAADLGDMSVVEIGKHLIKQVTDSLASFKQMDLDKEKIDKISTQIENLGRGVMKPMPESLTIQFLLKKMFPSYQILIKEEDQDYTKEIFSYLQQELTPYFNYFVMSNTGVEYFNEKAVETYGCVLNVVSMPEQIDMSRFNLSDANIVVNSTILPKKEAQLMLKRKRSDLEFEQDTAANAGGADAVVELEDIRDNIELGLASISAGNKVVESDIKFLVLGNSLKELNEKRSALIQACRDINISLTFAPNQAKNYIDSFCWNRGYDANFLLELRYILSFQANRGVQICDDNSKFTSPIFAYSVDNMSEMVE